MLNLIKISMIVIYLLFLLSNGGLVEGSDCMLCVEDQIYIWGMGDNYVMVPNTLNLCWGIIHCNYALCYLVSNPNVLSVVLQIGNQTYPQISFDQNSTNELTGTCTEGQNIVYGLDCHNQPVQGSLGFCWGLLSCNNLICFVAKIKSVNYVVIETSHP
jgi:hypothetical protein